jgi:hypothetical protein
MSGAVPLIPSAPSCHGAQFESTGTLNFKWKYVPPINLSTAP